MEDVKVNANLNENQKNILIESMRKIFEVFSNLNATVEFREAFCGKCFLQFLVEDVAKTNYNESMIDKLTYNLGVSFVNSKIIVSFVDNGKPNVLQIQIPTKNFESVDFKDAIQSKEFQESPKSAFLVGENVKGRMVVCDFQTQKHVIIAGMRESGKTNFLNVMISSLLLKNNSEEMKLLIFDKKGDLHGYRNLPHILFHDIVTNFEDAVKIFEWVVEEIKWRKSIFERSGCRTIEEYNRYAKVTNQKPFSAILIIVDELRNWMANENFKKLVLENLSIQKIADLGFFTAISTDDPAQDVLSEKLKSVFKTRIVLKVDYPLNSRVLLNRTSAMKLCGNGDLIFYNDASKEYMRLLAPIIQENDIEKVKSIFEEE